MESTVKIWVTKDNFKLIQSGLCPTDFETVVPRHISEYIEMNVGLNTITEWTNKHRNETMERFKKQQLND